MSRRPESTEGGEQQGLGGMSDADLAELARAGRGRRRAAFRELHSRHDEYLTDFLRNQGLNRAAARDLAADTWKRVWAHFHRFNPGLAKFRTWLTTIAHNLAKNWRRDRSRDPQITFTRLASGKSEDEPDVEWEDPAAGPDRHARRRQLRRLIADAEEELSAPYRTMFQLREREGRSYEEIAEETGLPLGTVKSRIYRARRELQGHLADRFAEYPRLLPEPLRHLARPDA